jgi:hypothetical protein
MAQEFSIISTQPYTYLDASSRVVNGYRVTFQITAYGEAHYVDVPSLDPVVVHPQIQKVVDQRKALQGK